MSEKSKSVFMPVMTAVVFAGLSWMLLQKVKADRSARTTKVAGPLDEKTRQWVNEVVQTPRQ